ncbi:hypothetical protein HID58_032214 [Brassica napus]|uniref:Uncharacterized protein n=1 Tax=Brassica napus TaxID=3708 RepID=A0ABQ8BVW7_BRANA|nr:hypothetical protein HID58_032214 [Brassica napus]
MEVERDQTVPSPTVPIVDLSNLDKELVARAVVKASQEWGVFQVVNHEIPKELIQSLKKVGTHFFELSSEAEKEAVATPANSKDIQGYVTNSQQDVEDKVNEEYARQAKKLAEKILGWLSEGLGLDREALFNQDIHGLTILVPNEIPGLQVFKDDQWFDRMSNGKYKNVLHRTTLNTEKTRMSWVVLLKPPYDMVIEPLMKHTGDGDEAPKFKPITYGEHVERKVRDKLQKRS